MKQLINAQRDFFYTNQTKSIAFRTAQLKKLKKMIQTYEGDLLQALYTDLSKSAHESFTTEIGLLYTEINFTLKHLKKWAKKKEVKAPLTHKGTTNYIMSEPYGATLLISPWNYPVQLALLPAIGAIAAGNTVILKPSELSVNTSSLLSKMITTTFDPAYFTVVEGGKEVSEQLLRERFDYIFFTGSTRVGKIVMEKASAHLTPVTLELGGKSPAIVDKDCSLKLTAKRIVWGKFTNAGQTCVAPDYLYVHEQIYPKFLKEVNKQIALLYGKKPLQNDRFVNIISAAHFNRLTQFIHEEHVIYGGKSDCKTLKIEPTVVRANWDDPVMQEEIFGPILPVLPFSNIEEVITTLQTKEKSLALYYFGVKNEKMVTNSLSFGGGCVNDTLYHLANPHLPFGGVGHSGIGAYHGKHSFNTFSHQKSMLKQSTAFDIPVRYPNCKLPLSALKRMLR